MIKYILTVISFVVGYGIKKDVTEFGEKELNQALQIIAGITTECLVAKRVVLDSICLEKQMGKESVVLYHAHFDEFSYRYLSRKSEV